MHSRLTANAARMWAEMAAAADTRAQKQCARAGGAVERRRRIALLFFGLRRSTSALTLSLPSRYITDARATVRSAAEGTERRGTADQLVAAAAL